MLFTLCTWTIFSFASDYFYFPPTRINHDACVTPTCVWYYRVDPGNAWFDRTPTRNKWLYIILYAYTFFFNLSINYIRVFITKRLSDQGRIISLYVWRPYSLYTNAHTHTSFGAHANHNTLRRPRFNTCWIFTLFAYFVNAHLTHFHCLLLTDELFFFQFIIVNVTGTRNVGL